MTPVDDERRYRAVLRLPLAGPEGLEPLLAALSDDSWRVRKAAVERLVSEVPAAEVIPRLVFALSDDESASRRSAALEALVRLGEGALPALREAAGGPDPELRKFAVDALAAIGSPLGTDSALSALDDPDPNVRLSAIEALGRLGGAVAVRALVGVLRQGAPEARGAALDALWRSSAPVPFALLAGPLGERRSRRAAVRALGHCPEREALQQIVGAMLDRARGVRSAALAAWAVRERRTGPLDLPAVSADDAGRLFDLALEGLAAEDALAAEGAARVLGALDRGEAAPALAQAAEREELRSALKRSLARLGSRGLEHVGPLFPLLPAAGQALVLEALREGVAAGAGASMAASAQALALQWIGNAADEVVRLGAIALLGALAAGDAIGPLAELLGEEPTISGAAEEALTSIAGQLPERLRAVCRAEVRSAGRAPAEGLLRLLGRVGTREDAAWLAEVLEHESAAKPACAAAALEALQELGAVNEVLVSAAAASDHPVLAAAGIRAATAAGLWPVIHRHVAHPRWEVRCQVAAALRAEAGPGAEALLREMLGRETVPLAAEEETAALLAVGGSPAA